VAVLLFQVRQQFPAAGIDLLSPAIKLRLLSFWEIRIGLHFEDLLRVALAVSRDVKQPLIRVKRLAQWRIGDMIP
jgi:hypothetical protein